MTKSYSISDFNLTKSNPQTFTVSSMSKIWAIECNAKWNSSYHVVFVIDTPNGIIKGPSVNLSITSNSNTSFTISNGDGSITCKITNMIVYGN